MIGDLQSETRALPFFRGTRSCIAATPAATRFLIERRSSHGTVKVGATAARCLRGKIAGMAASGRPTGLLRPDVGRTGNRSGTCIAFPAFAAWRGHEETGSLQRSAPRFFAQVRWVTGAILPMRQPAPGGRSTERAVTPGTGGCPRAGQRHRYRANRPAVDPHADIPVEVPILYVPGNHEFYGHALHGLHARLKETATQCPGVHPPGNARTVPGIPDASGPPCGWTARPMATRRRRHRRSSAHPHSAQRENRALYTGGRMEPSR